MPLECRLSFEKIIFLECKFDCLAFRVLEQRNVESASAKTEDLSGRLGTLADGRVIAMAELVLVRRATVALFQMGCGIPFLSPRFAASVYLSTTRVSLLSPSTDVRPTHRNLKDRNLRQPKILKEKNKLAAMSTKVLRVLPKLPLLERVQLTTGSRTRLSTFWM